MKMIFEFFYDFENGILTLKFKIKFSTQARAYTQLL